MVDKDQVNHLHVNKDEELEEKLSHIADWQEWYDIEKISVQTGGMERSRC